MDEMMMIDMIEPAHKLFERGQIAYEAFAEKMKAHVTDVDWHWDSVAPEGREAWAHAQCEVQKYAPRENLYMSTHDIVSACHGASLRAGWWRDLKSGTDYIAEVNNLASRFGKALVAEKLALVHSEVSEALEGHRKGLMDDKLPHRTMLEVELADAVIRIADLAGALGLDLGGAIVEKLAFNAIRPDHKIEARAAEGGKAY